MCVFIRIGGLFTTCIVNKQWYTTFMTYTYSEKRRLRDRKQADWETRLFILRKRGQNWTYQAIADELGCTRQYVEQTYKKIKRMTVKEAEQLVLDNQI